MSSTSGKSPAICLNQVSFAFDGMPVLEEVDLDIEQGDFACAVGPNGGGKTTLLRLILGLLRPDAGSVRVLGLEPDKVRGRIGYVPQNASYDPSFPVTVLDVVSMGLLGERFFGWLSAEDRNRAQAALEDVGLRDLAARPYRALSGGQRQRVLVARAIGGEPDLLLLDEPTSGIDPAQGKDFEEMLRRLNERMTILLVSHDLRFVSEMSERVVCVNRRVHVHPTSRIDTDSLGRIYGRPVRVIRHDRHLEHRGHDHA